MKFGFSFGGLSPRFYPALAAEAEAAGYESVWVPDHLVLPERLPATYPYADGGQPPITSHTAVYDPWVLLGAIATATERIRLGTNVYVLPLRHPIVTARAVLTVDRISRGRVTLGAGVGWLKEEFAIVGESAADRGRRADEIIGLLRRLWTEEVVSHEGTYYRFPPVRFEPMPFQRPIPIEIGGTSPQALHRAGSLGDGWIHTGSTDPEALRAMLAVIHGARAAAGRQSTPFTVTATLGTDLDSVRRAKDLGVDRVVAGAWAAADRPGEQAYRDAMRRFADEVIAKF
jgi:probable F420-dependent oxidoreductase